MKRIHALLLLLALCFPVNFHVRAAPIDGGAKARPSTERIIEIALQTRPGYPTTLGRLSGVAQSGLTPARMTRTGAQVLQFSQAVSVAEAHQILDRLRLLPEVLWAELVPNPIEQAAKRSQFLSAQQARSSNQIALRLRNQDDLPQQILAQLSRTAGTELTYLRAMSGGAHLLALPRNVTASELAVLSRLLEQHPDVLYADPVVSAKPRLTPNDTYYPLQWNLFELPGGANLPAAWDISTGSAGIVVAVIDGGILPHPDLAGKVLAGYDMVTDTTISNDGDGRDNDPTDPGDWVAADECGPGEPAHPSDWHGTHVAGIVGAATNNGSGVAGVGWNSRILPVRTGGKCGATSSDVIDSIRWAVGLAVPGAPTNTTPAKVINISLGGENACFSSIQSAINDALASGAVVVVAAGNKSQNVATSWPANCSGVIAVAANGRSGDATAYTNYGSLTKISAPGGDGPDGGINAIGSTYNIGTTIATTHIYQSIHGTSMAAPHVSGIVALMFAVKPSLTPSQVLSYLQSSARPFAAGTWCAINPGNCGSGMVNAGTAIALAQAGQVIPQTGWWWNPNQSGRGFMIERRGGNLFMASYLYASNGRATWYASGGNAGSSSYQGNLTAYINGQTLTGSYVAPTSPGAVGSVSIQFSNATHGILTWPGGAMPVERFNIVANGLGAPAASFQPESGWWWNPTESGRGFALEIQNGSLFMAGYMYDSLGNPIWYSSAGTMAASDSYRGTWIQWGNGQTLSGSYKAPSIVNSNVGSIELFFTSTTDAILTLPDGRQMTLTRFHF